jgi:hypothetical protein
VAEKSLALAVRRRPYVRALGGKLAVLLMRERGMTYAVFMILAIALVIALVAIPHPNKFNLRWPFEKIES